MAPARSHGRRTSCSRKLVLPSTTRQLRHIHSSHRPWGFVSGTPRRVPSSPRVYTFAEHGGNGETMGKSSRDIFL